MHVPGSASGPPTQSRPRPPGSRLLWKLLRMQQRLLPFATSRALCHRRRCASSGGGSCGT
eukprot:8060300-Lingulodinium_polyedra.AAC.1